MDVHFVLNVQNSFSPRTIHHFSTFHGFFSTSPHPQSPELTSEAIETSAKGVGMVNWNDPVPWKKKAEFFCCSNFWCSELILPNPPGVPRVEGPRTQKDGHERGVANLGEKSGTSFFCDQKVMLRKSMFLGFRAVLHLKFHRGKLVKKSWVYCVFRSLHPVKINVVM